jgi:hypothetical protein
MECELLQMWEIQQCMAAEWQQQEQQLLLLPVGAHLISGLAP